MTKYNVLVADDMVAIHQLLGQILQPLNCRMIFVKSAEDAVKTHFLRSPDLIFLDINMPGRIDGLGALQAIKKHAPRAYVVMITGKTDRDSIGQALAAKANDYVVKPFAPVRIKKVFEKFILEQAKMSAQNPKK